MLSLAITTAAWAVVGAIEDASWDAGRRRALLALALLIAATTLAVAARCWRLRAPRSRPTLGLIGALVLGCACLPAVFSQVELGVSRFRAPHLNDIPLTTMAAARAMAAGRNPYLEAVDPRKESSTQHRNYDGFKYLPMMAVAYAPAALADSARTVVVTNALLHALVAVLIFVCARSLAGSLPAAFGLLFYLWLSIVPRQMFGPGVTDYAAIVPLVAAFALGSRMPLLAGLLVGLSLSAKLVPALPLAALIAPFGVPWRGKDARRYWIGFACGCVPSVIYFLWAPGALVDNVLLFNLSRPVDSTSWLDGHPYWWRTTATIGLAALFASTAVVRWIANADRHDRATLIVVATLGTTLLGPINHGNYQLWWIPWVAVLMADCLAPVLSPPGDRRAVSAK